MNPSILFVRGDHMSRASIFIRTWCFTLLTVLLTLSSTNIRGEQVLLGDPALTAGVPGNGPISVLQIETWLDDEHNFTEFTPVLPLGLSQGSSQITGLDENPLTRAKIELGRQLYFDPRLSVDSTVSCASCHDPSMGIYSADKNRCWN